MNIIIDVTRVVRRLIKRRTLTGIDRVTMAYVHHYGATAKALMRWSGHSWILSRAQSDVLFSWLAAPGSTWTVVLIIIKGILSNTHSKTMTPTFLLNTGHVGLGRSDYENMTIKLGIKPVFFVHDLIPIAYPEYCCVGEDARHREKMNYILKLADGVITNSQATLDDLIQYAHQTQQIMPRAEVALLASSISTQRPGKRPINKPYFVILSTIEPRKNHLLLLQIWRRFSQELGERAPHLFVIGQRGWECENALDMLERCPFLTDVVTEIAHCTDADLVTYLHHSQALLFPSFIEGYGLPLVEALALGIPVIASNLPVFNEIAGDVPDYIDPLDGKCWKDMIMDYAQTDSVHRAAQIIRIQHFLAPTWTAHFQKVDAFLTEE